MLLLAHRGASADAPENTLCSFQEAVAQGADGVELDVMVCGSGEVVVCHDQRLDRLAGLPWEVAHTPWWKLRQVELGTALGFSAERIPLLEEVFEALPPHLLVNVELKGTGLDDHGLARKVGEYLTGAGLEERVILSSFNPAILFRLAAGWPRLRRGTLIDPDSNFLLQASLVTQLVSSYSIHPHFQDCTAERVARWHQQGLKVAAWTVDEPAQGKLLAQAGVDFLITNRPAKMKKALARRPRGPRSRAPKSS